MRKVKFVTHGFFGGQNSSAPGPVKEGWFHGFFQEGNNEGGIDPVAVVETLIGECISIGVKQIKFESQPAEIQGDGQALRTTGNNTSAEEPPTPQGEITLSVCEPSPQKCQECCEPNKFLCKRISA